jgi:hypothetical protein
MCVSKYVHTVKSYQYTSQIKELHWHESYSPALCRLRLPTQLTKTSQLQLTHIAAAVTNALGCYTPTFRTPPSKAYPHAPKSCLGKLGKINTWVPGLLWNTSKGFPGRMVKPSTDFIQLWLNTTCSEPLFVGPANVIHARLELTPHDCNHTHNLQYLLYFDIFIWNVLGCSLIGSADSTKSPWPNLTAGSTSSAWVAPWLVTMSGK